MKKFNETNYELVAFLTNPESFEAEVFTFDTSDELKTYHEEIKEDEMYSTFEAYEVEKKYTQIEL